MFFKSGVAALAVSYLTTAVLAEETQTCPYKPAWNTCKGDNYAAFQCATILVTKSYIKPAGTQNTMELNLIRYPAKNNNSESIIVNFGGPGESGIQGIIGQGEDLSKQVNGSLHIVGFDPRGVGINDPYDCEPETQFPGSSDFSDQTVVDNYYKAALARAKECDTKNPDKGKQIGTYAVAKDVRQIARAVGVKDKLIRYWGFSYGTVLGDTIARLFPEEIGGMVLDGNINPNDYWLQFPVEEAANIDAGVRHFFKLCADAKNDCAWNTYGNGTYESLLDKFDKWVGATPSARGNASTLSIEDSYSVRNVINQGIKYGSTYKKCANVLEYWHSGQGTIEFIGDFSEYKDPTLQKRQAVSDDNGNFTPAESTTPNNNVLTAITGSDNGFREPLSGAVYTKYLQKYNAKSQYAGDLAVDNLWKYAPWVARAEEYFTTPFQNIETSPRPIVFIQTHYDPVTPSDSGKAAHEAFVNSRYVTTEGVGHCSSSDSSRTLQADIGKYWQTDFLPETDTDYKLDNANPFVVTPSNDQNVETNQSAKSRRDFSELFSKVAVLSRRATEDADLTCDDIGNTTTTSGTNTSTTANYGNGTTSATSSLTASWGQWSTLTTRTSSTPKETGSWALWNTKSSSISDPSRNTWNPPDPSTTTWKTWASSGPSNTITTYVYTVVDVCETGLSTSTVTITATCDKNKGCGSKPAVPTGYKTTEVYCSACSTPSKVSVTVKITETATWTAWSSGSSVKASSTAKPVEWSAMPADPAASSVRASGTIKPAEWNAVPTGASASSSAKPTEWSAVSGSATGTSGGSWDAWASASTTGPVAKYTGGANVNIVARGGIYAAIVVGAWAL